MKKYLNLLVILLVFLGLFFLISCSSSQSSNDSDSIPDADSDTHDSETVDDDSDTQQTEIVDDSDEAPDHDSDQDTDSEDDDWHRDIDIPEMSDDPYYEAYGDAGYNVAYYYYGDDPTPSQDPENVKALWSKRCGISKCYECEPQHFDLCAENYPFEPQIVDDSKDYDFQKTTTAGKFQCDGLLTPGFWKTSDLAISMQLNEFEGKILYYMDGGTYTSWQGGGSYAYDLNTRKVERYSRDYMDGWQNKRYYFISTYDYRIDSLHKDSLYYGEKNRHLLYYDKETNSYGTALKFSETPREILDIRASDTYLFATMYFENANDKILYTKIGEWDKWKELTYKKETLYGNSRRAGYPSMIGSLVTYFDYDIQVQVCDLDIGDSSCFQVSRADEYGRYPIFKDKNTIIYSSEKTSGTGRSLVEADISDKNSIKYRTIYNDSKMNSLQPQDIENNNLLFGRKYSNGGSEDVKDVCLYDYKTEKIVCMDEDFDLEFQKDDGVLYKNLYIFRSVQDLVIRDLECYCDFYPNKCPLIEYKPNPENLKKPWEFDWKPENLRNVNNKKDGEKR